VYVWGVGIVQAIHSQHRLLHAQRAEQRGAAASFYGTISRPNLEALKIEYLTFDEEGLVVSLGKTKNQLVGLGPREGHLQFLRFGAVPHPLAAGLVTGVGPRRRCVFVSLRKKRRLTTKYINLIAQQYLGNGYATHSLRASYVTVSKPNGADDSKVINHTKHKTSAMIRRYTKLDNVRQHNSAKELSM
jgi:hypothetical protein